MINKSFLLASLLSISILASGQVKKKNHLGYRVSFGFGNSTLENNQLGILNGNLLALKFNIDHSFTEMGNTKFSTGIQFMDFNSNFSNGVNQSKLKNEYLQIPFILTHRISLDKDDKLKLVTGIGTYANFLLRSNITTLSGQINTKSGGVNFGYNVVLGLEYDLSHNTSINIHSDIMNEFSEIKKNRYVQKQKEIVLFSIGFSSKF